MKSRVPGAPAAVRYGQRVKMVDLLKSDSRVAEELLDDEARMQSGGREGSLRREAGRAVCSGTRRVQRYTVRGETAGEGGGGGRTQHDGRQ